MLCHFNLTQIVNTNFLARFAKCFECFKSLNNLSFLIFLSFFNTRTEYMLRCAAQVFVRLCPTPFICSDTSKKDPCLHGHSVSRGSCGYQQCCSIALQHQNPTPFVFRSQSLCHSPGISTDQRARRTSTSNVWMKKGTELHLLGLCFFYPGFLK